MNAKDYYGYLEDARRKQDALKHYGITGQKWGVRHWQYSDGRFTPEGKERYFGKKESNEKMGDIATALAVWAGITAATAVTARGVDAVHNVKVNKRIKEYEDHLQTEEVDKKTGLRLKSNPDSDIKEDMKTINMEHGYNMFSDVGVVAGLISSGKYNEKRDGYTQNCMLCTTALDLKRKGYDVRAGKSNDGYDADDIKKWYKNAEVKNGSYKEIAKEIKSLPEGAYGNLMVCWTSGGGHSMFFRVENGKIAVYDAQVNMKIKNIDNHFINTTGAYFDSRPGKTWYVRTDNLEPNIDYLKKNNLIRY